MASAAVELQKAVFVRLTGDIVLTAMLGGHRIYDAVPRGAEYPYVTFGPTLSRDFSTGSESGEEHTLTLNVWSQAAGHSQTHDILSRLRERLHDANLSLVGHRLINLRHDASEALRDAGGESYRGIARFRAVTEPTS